MSRGTQLLIVVLAAGCAPATKDHARAQQALEGELVVDQDNPLTWPWNQTWCAIPPSRLGQQFVPSYDNVAAATLHAGMSTPHQVPVRILDASYNELGATAVDVQPIGPGFTAYFDPPVPVVPGNVYVLETVLPAGNWYFNDFDSYPAGDMVTWCTGVPLLRPLRDFVFTTYAAISLPSFDDVQETVAETSTDPADGEMTGPNEHANAGRLGAFSNMIDAAEALFDSDQFAEGCDKLAAARAKVTQWFAGETVATLLAMIDSLSDQHGCP